MRPALAARRREPAAACRAASRLRPRTSARRALSPAPTSIARLGGGADLADLLVQAAALPVGVLGERASEAGEAAGAGERRRLRRGGRARRRSPAGGDAPRRRRPGSRPRRRASGSSSRRRRRRRAASGRTRGRRRRSPGRAAARRCGIGSRRRRPRGRSSEPPPRAITIASTSSIPARSVTARAIRGAAWRSCTGGCAKTARPAQERRARPARRSASAAEPRPVTTPIVRGSAGRGRRDCGSNRPSSESLRRSVASWASRSPSPARRRSVQRNEKEGEAVALPG